jgi:hypothetical protein
VGSSVSVTWIICVWALAPICTLLHELGHAAVALRLTRDPVLVQVGTTKHATRVHFGRLHMSLSLYGAGGFCRSNANGLTRAQHLERILAGPVVNLLLAATLVPFALHSHGTVHVALICAVLTNALMGVGNLVPRHGHLTINRGRPSDGLQAWCLLRRRPVPPPPQRVASKSVGSSLKQPVTPAVLFDVVVVVTFEMLVFAHVIAEPVAIAAFLAFVTRAAWARGGAREPPTRRRPAVQTSPPSPVSMKLCPACGAHVQHLAKLCYCYHAFE